MEYTIFADESASFARVFRLDSTKQMLSRHPLQHSSAMPKVLAAPSARTDVGRRPSRIRFKYTEALKCRGVSAPVRGTPIQGGSA